MEHFCKAIIEIGFVLGLFGFVLGLYWVCIGFELGLFSQFTNCPITRIYLSKKSLA
jgi:hypothetical protein